MKKVVAAIFMFTFVWALTACGGSQNPENQREPPASEAALEQRADQMPQDAAEAEEKVETMEGSTEEKGESSILVAYFSWSGNTQQMAEIIAQETGADLFEIATVTPYTDDYNTLLDIAQQEQGEDARPELNAQVENWDSYDTIFVGYPNWWSDAPMAVYTFLESYDFTGKTLIPFNTSASGGFGRSLIGIEESAAGATLLEGLDLTEGELGDVENRVTTWLDSLGLNR